MVRQKAREEKYPRITITLSPSLHCEVTERVRAEGLTLSGLVSELLTTWLNGSDEEKPNTPILELESRITALESSIHGLIHTDTNQCIPIHTDKQEDRLTVTPEMRDTMRARLKELRGAGMSHHDIFQLTGIPEGTQKKLISPNQALKTITHEQYEKLLTS